MRTDGYNNSPSVNKLEQHNKSPVWVHNQIVIKIQRFWPLLEDDIGQIWASSR